MDLCEIMTIPTNPVKAREYPRRPSVLFCTGILLSLVLYGCEKPVVETGPIVRPIKMFTIERNATAEVLEYPGEIKATQNAEMAFEVSGKIEEFLVREGTAVNKGDLLARLDARDYQAELEVVQANVKKAEADYQRSMNIYKEDKGAITQTKIDADLRAVEVSKAQLQQAQKAVEDTELRAPFDGIMARKLVEDFQNVKAKEPVLILQDNSRLEVEISVPERDVTTGANKDKTRDELVAEIRPEVIVTSIPDRSFPAEIKEFATTADTVTRTFQIRLVFDNPEDVQILPGMTAKVRVQAEQSQGIWVPAHAVVADANGKPFVWVVDETANTVSKKPVMVGSLAGSSVEIEDGLDGGELIAQSGIHQLRDGMEVRRYERNL